MLVSMIGEHKSANIWREDETRRHSEMRRLEEAGASCTVSGASVNTVMDGRGNELRSGRTAECADAIYRRLDWPASSAQATMPWRSRCSR